MSDQRLLLKLSEFVREIPVGKVTTFWHLARALGIVGNRSALRVGQLVAMLQGQDIPFHRVVLKLRHRGMVPLKSAKSRGVPMVDVITLLKQEGVPFDGDYICLRGGLWVPNGSVTNSDPNGAASRETCDQLDATEKNRKVV